MKGDFSRLTFDKTKHYRSTRLQQGRVSVDADWNEESDIANYRLDTETTDIIGCCGAPIYHSGFHIVTDTTQLTAEELDLDENDSPDPLADPADFYISGGRMYVGGRLIENERIIAYTLQPELPQLKPVVDPGVYLAYLDVWDRHITALEDPDIREVALGGPDTATRIKNTWQVKLLRIGDDDDSDSLNCLSEVKGLYTEPTGQLTARSEPDGTSSNPCIVAPAAGYRRLENQLYRIEVHQGGTRNAATFKWSRDNGSVVARWESQNGNDISVSSVGRDKVLQFKAGMWVELIDDERILLGQAGTLVRIEMVNDRVLTLDTTTATDTFDIADFGTNKKVRRWDSIGVLDPSGSGWYDIEDGVQVKFSSGTYNVGDYWMIPARTNIGDILWPKQGTTWQAVSPHGTTHAICRLAIMTFDGTTWASIDDCRPIFVPLKDMIQFDYIGGDGQEAIPGDQLDRPIQVGVARGSHPVANARVRFRRMSTTGSLSSSSGMTEESGSAQQRIVLTDDEGMARVNWRLGGPTSPVTQTVRAELLAVDDTRLHLPIHFNARLSIASQVWFDNSNCQTFSGGDTVQYAIDTMAGQAKLIRYGGEGQNARPGEVVPCPLQIIVANVCGPVANARVVFNPDGKGRVAVNPSALPSATPASVIVQTDATGLAQVYWQLDPDPDRICQHVQVELTDAGGREIHDPAALQFTACTNGSGECDLYFDDLRSDGVVRIPPDGPLGFEIVQRSELQIEHSGGVAYVGGSRFEISPGVISVSPERFPNTLIIDDSGNLTFFDPTKPPPAYELIADIYVFENLIQRIVDRRRDMTHLDEQLETVRGRVAAKRCDRRRSIPLLAQTLPDLEYADGRNHFVLVPTPMGMAFDGTSVWTASLGNSVAVTPKHARYGDTPELINVGMPTTQCAFDGKTHMWFLSSYKLVNNKQVPNNQVISINIKTRQIKTYTVGTLPWALACDGERVWVVSSETSTVSVIDPARGQVIRTMAVIADDEPVLPSAIVYDGEFMWMAGNSTSIVRMGQDFKPITMDLKLTGNTHGLGFDGSHLWISQGTQPEPGQIIKMDVVTTQRESLDRVFCNFLCDGKRMWAFHYPETLSNCFATAFDCTTSRVEGVFPIGYRVMGGVFDGSHIWLSLISAGTTLSHSAHESIGFSPSINAIKKYAVT